MDNQFEKQKEQSEEFCDYFLDGNEQIKEAIANLYNENNQENFVNVLESIRHRMHADGHFIFPVLTDEKEPGKFAFCTIQSNDGKVWQAAFTSQEEFEKGEKTSVISYFIDAAMKACLDTDNAGIIINPWGQAFLLERALMEDIFRIDGDTEYSVPDEQITAELLEDGSFLKKATEICNRNSTQLNMIKLLKILRDSYVWVPQFTNKDEYRLVPDTLQNGEDFFFPVFTSEEEMGEYGDHFSHVPQPFLEAIALARHNEKDVVGIVINAFSEPFVINRELFEMIEGNRTCIA